MSDEKSFTPTVEFIEQDSESWSFPDMTTETTEILETPKKSPLKRCNANVQDYAPFGMELGPQLIQMFEARVKNIGTRLISKPNMVENYQLFVQDYVAWDKLTETWPTSTKAEVALCYRAIKAYYDSTPRIF